jgi:N-acetylated-alpha-linked acidic dipeptidase
MLRAAFALSLCLSLVIAQSSVSYRGYDAAGAAQEHVWEMKYRSLPSPANLKADMERLAAHPHHVGSPYDNQNAQWILAQFKSWGLDAHIETFDVLFPTPKERKLEMLSPSRFEAQLAEPPLSVDPTSNQTSEQLPTYNAYSGDGDVTAPLVYVNHGIPADYEVLDRLGISVKGAIVIARYGGSWRGIKPKVAYEHGAIGCIIYSDPREDGYTSGNVFPDGAWRPPFGVQRGSVADMPLYAGDPLTPGVGATKDAKRLPLSETPVLMKIPVLPISYSDARPLLAALGGEVVPPEWRGGLDITYHTGPGPAKVHLVMKSNWDRKPIHDVIAIIPGSTFPDQWVIRGNHHDAWVNGAEDPVSGTISLLEEARSMAELLKQGWRPKRTIVFAAWDGEEPGLLGSTEWAETHAAELSQKAVAYINSDSNGRGFLHAGGSHSLEMLVNQIARDVEDPETHLSVWKRLELNRMVGRPSPASTEQSRGDLPISALGSGSDYTPFLQHLGIASVDLGFGGEDGGGIYHSIYDDIYWYEHFSDRDFVYGRALAQIAGTLVMRLAGASVPGFEFNAQARTFSTYLEQVKTLWKTTRDQIEAKDRLIEAGAYKAAADPRKPFVAPVTEAMPPFLDFSPLENAVDHLKRAAASYERAYAANPSDSSTLAGKVYLTERMLLDTKGLPRRPWFEHMVYAPGFYTGYGVKTFPAVREAIEQKQWSEAGPQIARTAAAIEREAQLLDSMATMLH